MEPCKRIIHIEAIIDGSDDNNYYLKSDEDADPVRIRRGAMKILKRHPGFAEIQINEHTAIVNNLV